MLTKKQLQYLKGQAHHLSALYQVGKNELGETQLDLLDKALTARELIKITVLKSATLKEDELADILSKQLHADVVDVKGHTIVLFRQKRPESKFKLPA